MQKKQIRIIAGKWKSRRLKIATVPQLRPSPDAVRETLFNWLPHDLHGKSCLDLFAGSGAFGFEAASRGAANVVFVESARDTVKMLHENHAHLQADETVDIVASSVEKFLDGSPPPAGFDIVFLDPPFAAADSHLAAACDALRAREWLRPHALVYIESPRAPLPIPASWRIIRQNHCGLVQSTLIET